MALRSGRRSPLQCPSDSFVALEAVCVRALQFECNAIAHVSIAS
jgi:hypothetical protein